MAEQFVVEITAAQTHPLRRAVLRADTPTDDVEFAEDTWPGAYHLGVVDGDELIATSSWIPRELATQPGSAAVQLRGMATLQGLQGRGVGAMLLAAGIERARVTGALLVWANARDAAMGFYERNGFQIDGEGFIDATTQLPHHRVVHHL
jgi:GNAT superfamily N-acetyltransferase